MSRSDPSASNQTSKATTLKAGLAALKQGDYQTAIQLLQRCADDADVPATDPSADPSEASIGVRAQVGLVTAYERQGNTEQAIALCLLLGQNPNNQVKTWAERTLAGFTKRYPQLVQAATIQSNSGLQAGERSPESSPLSTPTEADATGFTPLTPGPSVQPARRTPKITAPTTPERPQPTASSSETTVETASAPEPPSEPREWRQAGRAQKWSPLGKVKRWRLWLLEAGTAIAFVWFARWLFQALLRSFNWVLVKLPWVEPIQFLYRDPTIFVLGVVGLLLVALPWLMDGLLKLVHGIQPLPTATLANHSPEATRVLNRLCRQNNLPVPVLKVLPIATPLMLSYGVLPRTARITVSQGLLEQLADDEIAALYAAEIAHIAHWDAAVLSWVVLVLQIPYLLYWQLAAVADWLDRKRQSFKGHKPIAFYPLTAALHVVAVGSAISYGIYWLLRWPLLWLSRQRIYYSDRMAAEFTGNPNGLTRALLKIAIGTAEAIRRQGKTSYGLEGLELLTPLSYQSARHVGSFYPTLSFTALLEWDRTNPYRGWLNLNHAHPLLGDRLQLLTFYARHWRLETELDWPDVNRKPAPKLSPWQWSRQYGLRLLLQAAPYLGAWLGLLLGLSIWLLGGLANLLGAWKLFWVMGDRAILLGCIPLGISLGIFLRINRFFPDITAPALRIAPPLPQLVANPMALPIDSQPIQLQGKLLGRPGVANWLGQDLVLQTEMGLIKLHHVSPLGPIGSLLPQAVHPNDLVNQTVTAKGWLHRGATPWIDLETLRTSGGKTQQSGHPIWATLLAGVAVMIGIYILLFMGGY